MLKLFYLNVNIFKINLALKNLKLKRFISLIRAITDILYNILSFLYINIII